MNKKVLGAMVAVLVIAITLFFWQRGRNRKAQPGRTAATAPGKVEPPTARRMKSDELPPQPPPPVAMDDDPVGNLRLEGQVLDADDAPVEGATVTISSNPQRTATTEGDGSFHFDQLVGRTYALRARAGSRIGGPLMHQLTPTSDPAVLRLHAGGEAVITVVGPDDAPIAGATVELRSGDLQTELTDSDGIARFAGVPGGFLALVAYAPGYGPTRQPLQVSDSEGARVEARVMLHPGAAISGRVVDARGKPIAEARVLPIDASKLFSLVSEGRDGVVTDSKGRFTLAAIAAGTYRISARHPDHAPGSSAAITVDGSTPVQDVEIALAAGGVVKGKVVTADQQPAAWAAVRVGGDGENPNALRDVEVRQATADQRGEFEMRGLPRTFLAAIAMAEDASSEVVEIDLVTRDTAEVVIVLGITSLIAGRVVDSAGDPISEAQVTAYPDFLAGGPAKEFALRGMSAQTTDGGGGFAFRGLPDGTYRLRASRSSVATRDFLQPGSQAATGDTDVKLVLARTGGIKGKVASKDGSPVGVFTVTVGFPPGTPFSTRSGEFEVDALPPGKYDVTFRGSEFTEVAVRDVVVGEGEVTDLHTITVAPGRFVTGRVLDAAGAPVAGAAVIAATRLIGDGRSAVANLGTGADEAMGVRRDRTDEQGGFRVRGITTTKEQVLLAEHETRGRSMLQIIPPGETNPSYDLVLRGYGSLVGTVSVGGKPTPGLTVIATAKGGTNHNLVVTTGPDGGYVFERIPAGDHQIMAMTGGELGSGSSGSASAMIRAGAKTRTDIAIDVGEITFLVAIAGVDDAKIDAAQVFLFRGAVSPTNGQEVNTAFLEQGSSAMVAMALGKPAEFTQVTPADYNVCVLPISGDLNDPSFGQRLQSHAMSLKVYCQRHTVAGSPTRQTYTAVVPPMVPLPEDPPTKQR